MEKKYLSSAGLEWLLGKIYSTFSKVGHVHTKSQITDFPTIPTKTSQLTNDSDFITKSEIPVDSELSSDSMNPVQNTVIKKEFDNHQEQINTLSSEVVRVTKQTLTDEQRAQARANIGAATINDVSKEVAVMEEQTFAGFALDEGFGVHSRGLVFGTDIDPVTIVIGESYTVVWEGVRYENLVAQDGSAALGGSTAVFLGNGSFAGLPGNNEPFAVGYVNLVDERIVLASLDDSNLDSYTVGIYKTVPRSELPEVTTVDNGKTLRVVDGIWTVAESDSSVNEMVILEEQEFTGFVYDENFASYTPGYISPALFALVGGETYRVKWNNTEYSCVAYAYEYYGESVVYIGNGESLGVEGNGEPFLINYSITSDNTQMFSTDASESHTVGIYQIVITQDLPKVTTDDNGKILQVVDGVWSAVEESDAETDCEYTNVTILEYQNRGTFTANANYDGLYTCDVAFGDTISAFALVLDEQCTVVWDGQEYDVVAKDASAVMPGCLFVGNGSDFRLSGNNEPFVIGWNDLGAVLFSLDSEDSTHEVGIYKTALKPELPVVSYADNGKILQVVDGAWAAVEDSDDSYTIVLEEKEYTLKDTDTFRVIEESFTLSVGATYRVVWNDEEYICTAAELGDAAFIGNAAIADMGANTGEPFVMAARADTSIIATLDTANPIVGIYQIMTEPTLPEVTADDNGKILQVVDGVWSAVDGNSSDTVVTEVYAQEEEPINASEGALWVDLDEPSLERTYVNSINGKTGDVVLSASDVGALSDSIQLENYALKTYVDESVATGLTIANYDKHVRSINHRGYSSTAPENTIPAYILSKKNGFVYVEADVSFTSDGVAVLLHDSTIDRTSNGSGNVSLLTYAELLSYDFGSWKSSEYAGTKIPTFEKFIKLCKNICLHPYIELKSNGAYTEEQIQELVEMVKRYGMQGDVTWISFSSTFLNYIKEADPAARLGYLVTSITDSTITTVQGLKTETNEVFLDSSDYTSSAIELCCNADIPLEIWTINDEMVVRSLDAYITGITSDYINAGKVLDEYWQNPDLWNYSDVETDQNAPIININMHYGTNTTGLTQYNATTTSNGYFSNGKFVVSGSGALTVPASFMSGTNLWTIAFAIDSYTLNTNNTYCRVARGSNDVPSIFYQKTAASFMFKLANGTVFVNGIEWYDDTFLAPWGTSSSNALTFNIPNNERTIFVFMNDGTYITMWVNGEMKAKVLTTKYTSSYHSSTFSIGDNQSKGYNMSSMECSMLKAWNRALSEEEIANIT